VLGFAEPLGVNDIGQVWHIYEPPYSVTSKLFDFQRVTVKMYRVKEVTNKNLSRNLVLWREILKKSKKYFVKPFRLGVQGR
jgi:hypothetical protein